MIIAVDPGASGGIAWKDSDGIICAEPMPEGMTDQAGFIQSLVGTNPAGFTAIIERVGGYMPGNSGPAACKFARHCGHLEAICFCFSIPVEYVAPQTWMKSLGAMPKDKGDRKRAIKESMARLYPNLKVTMKTADALGILTYKLSKGEAQ